MGDSFSTALALREALAAGSLCAVEAAEACLARVAACEPALHAFTHIDRDGALAAARDVDASRARGEPLGPLAGVPVAIKDNICVRGMPTTCASRMLARYEPPYDAHVVEQLREAGAVILGKTNLDEFAMGSSTESSAVGATRNPWRVECTPGGSSGGSAAAVASGMVPLALGSDTGGSIRQPAGFCGCVGFKPTYGQVSRYGLVAFGSSLDQIGPMARSVEDVALLFGVLAGHDPRDSTSATRAAGTDCLAGLDQDLQGLRVGLPQEYFGEGLDGAVEAAVRGAVAALEARGAAVRDVALPHTRFAVPVYYVVATAEASSNLARYDGAQYGHRSAAACDVIEMYSQTREEGFGAEVKRRVMLGTYVLSAGYYDAYYLQALKVRTLMARDFETAWEEVDVLVAPTSPTVAFRLGEKLDDPLSMYLSDIYTLSANLAGIPAVSLPCAWLDGLPVGVQVMGQRFDDTRVLAAGRAIEQELGLGAPVAPVSG